MIKTKSPSLLTLCALLSVLNFSSCAKNESDEKAAFPWMEKLSSYFHRPTTGSTQTANTPDAQNGTSHDQNKEAANTQTSAPTSDVAKPGETTPQAASGPTCFTQTFHHKSVSSHNNEEACSHHRNLIKVAHAGLNPAALCFRVNGTPVKFQSVKGKSDEFLLPPIAGPQAKITARYCVGKSTCAEECKIPKGEFMDAIGGSEDEDSGKQAANLGHWDSKRETGADTEITQKLDSDIRHELADNGESADGTYVFQGWISDMEVAACDLSGRKVAGK
jgi:hypothetical protein